MHLKHVFEESFELPIGMIRRTSLPIPIRKKSENTKITPLKSSKKISKSPNLSKKQTPSESIGSGAKPKTVNTLHPPIDELQYSSYSTEDLDTLEGTSRENGSSVETALDEVDGHTPDPVRTKVAKDQLQSKIWKIMEQIKSEQTAKEANVNEYLRLASGADKQQIQRIKTVFEKKNQKSTHCIAQLQKKLENYQRKLTEVETRGVSSHKQAKEVLRDMGQGLKDVGANIMDGITGFSGGVVDNIKGAKDSIVSKPREFAHLIKNKFGSADNITHLATADSIEESQTEDMDRSHHGSGTLPASFKYGSEDDNSSITSGSGFGVQSSPHSASQNIPQQQHLSVFPQINIEPLLLELTEQQEAKEKMQEGLHQLFEDFDSYKTSVQHEFSVLRSLLEEERYRCERLEEQLNDLTELHQNEMTNIKQEMSSMEEKLEYQLEERTRDIHDLLENCQTRISKMEVQQQQQQQLISMEMVENVTFRTLLTKLINVVLAILAVILVFVSTAANLIAPFLTTRARILSTTLLIFAIVMSWKNWEKFVDLFNYLVQEYRQMFSKR